MTVREQVLSAANPREALLVLADAIDGLLSKPADPWSVWDEEHEHPADIEYSEAPLGATGEPMQGGPFTEQTDKSVGEINFPSPTDRQSTIRTELEDYLDFENLEGRDENGNKYRLFPREDTPERREAVEKLMEAFWKAGPVWLYLANRDHVLELPIDVRRKMIDDVEEVDPKYAYHMAKDILMDRGEQDGNTVLPLRSDPSGVSE